MNICFWPDGCWCHDNELPSMTHKSDAPSTIEIPDDTDEHAIDCIIFDAVSK